MSLQSFLLREAILYKSKSESDDFTPQDEKTLKVSIITETILQNLHVVHDQ